MTNVLQSWVEMSMTRKPTILAVDDDRDMLTLVSAALMREGFHVATETSAAGVVPAVRANKPEGILLDLVLPDGNGLNLIAGIRAITDVPIIVVSGKDELVDKIVGLEMGADDYVSKPLQVRELAARIKAQLRRYADLKSPQQGPETVKFAGWTLDRARMQVFDVHGNPADLTVKEFRLLDVLVSGQGRVLTRDQILDLARSDDINVTDRAIDTQITRIRKKLGDNGSNPTMIRSIRGAGYAFIARIE